MDEVRCALHPQGLLMDLGCSAIARCVAAKQAGEDMADIVMQMVAFTLVPFVPCWVVVNQRSLPPGLQLLIGFAAAMETFCG